MRGGSLSDSVRPAGGTTSPSFAQIHSAGAYLRRGVAAGLLAGIVSGLFLLAVGEPSIDRAIQLEHAAAHEATSGEHSAEEVFTRDQQHFGMILAASLYGMALGGVLGIVVFIMSRRMSGSAWMRSMRIALTGFAAYFLVPFLKYPANPPGVGNPDTIDGRTAAYLFLVVFSIATCLAGVFAARRLKEKGFEAHKRHLIVAACYLVVLTIAFVALPPGEAPEGVPAGLIWEFRMASIGGQAVLWTCTGALLGLMTLRAERRGAQEGLPVAE